MPSFPGSGPPAHTPACCPLKFLSRPLTTSSEGLIVFAHLCRPADLCARGQARGAHMHTCGRCGQNPLPEPQCRAGLGTPHSASLPACPETLGKPPSLSVHQLLTLLSGQNQNATSDLPPVGWWRVSPENSARGSRHLLILATSPDVGKPSSSALAVGPANSACSFLARLCSLHWGWMQTK